jgi:hypothetical protein
VRTRKDLRPDPEFDPICGIFYHAQTDSPCSAGANQVTGVICVDKESVHLMKNSDSRSKTSDVQADQDSRMYKDSLRTNDKSSSDLLTSSGGSGHQRREKRPLLARSGL